MQSESGWNCGKFWEKMEQLTLELSPWSFFFVMWGRASPSKCFSAGVLFWLRLIEITGPRNYYYSDRVFPLVFVFVVSHQYCLRGVVFSSLRGYMLRFVRTACFVWTVTTVVCSQIIFGWTLVLAPDIACFLYFVPLALKHCANCLRRQYRKQANTRELD